MPVLMEMGMCLNRVKTSKLQRVQNVPKDKRTEGF